MTPEQLKEITRGLYQTFQYVAQDLFQDGEVMKRDEVIEVTLDADYLESYGRVSKESLKLFRTLSYEEQIKIAETVFVHSRYS